MGVVKRVLLAVALVIGWAAVSHADVGIFERADCTTIASPSTGKTFCFDQTANALKLWTGTAWVNVVGGSPLPSFTLAGLPAAGTAGRLARVTDNIRGVWRDDGTKWASITGVANSYDWGVTGNDPGDGSGTDDSTAIASMLVNLAAITPAPTLVMHGVFNVGTTGIIFSQSGLKVLFDIDPTPAQGNVIYSGTGTAVTVGTTSGITYNQEVRDISVKAIGNAASTGAVVGIKVLNAHYFYLHKPITSYFGGTNAVGLQFTASTGYFTATGVSYHGRQFGNYIGVQLTGLSAAYTASHVTIDGGYTNGSQIGIDVQTYGINTIISHVDIQSPIIGINVAGNNTRIESPRFEGANFTSDIYIPSGISGTMILGPILSGAGAGINDQNPLNTRTTFSSIEYITGWVAWSPTLYKSDGTTVLSTTTTDFKYKRIANTVFYEGYAVISGTPDGSTYFTIPLTGAWTPGTGSDAYRGRGIATKNDTAPSMVSALYYNTRLVIGTGAADTSFQVFGQYELQ